MGESYGQAAKYALRFGGHPAKLILVTEEEKRVGEAAWRETLSDMMRPPEQQKQTLYRRLMRKIEGVSERIEEYYPSKILERYGVQPVINSP